MKTLSAAFLTLLIIVSTASLKAQNWLTTGNTGITPLHYLGTKDSNNLIFKTKGLERGRLTASGSWQFSAPLQLKGASPYIDITPNGYYSGSIAGAGSNLHIKANGSLILQTGYIFQPPNLSKPAGNVGIGTESPTTKLEVQTGNSRWGIAHTNGSVRVGTYIGSNGGWIATQSNSPLYFATSLLNTNSMAQMTLLQNGNFGIGVFPQYRLQVQTTGDAWGIVHSNGSIRVGTYIGSGGGWIGTQSNNPLHFCTNDSDPQMTLLQNGNFGIGTLTPQHKLSVNGVVQAKEVRVETGWADYVFEEGYELQSLQEVAKYIKENKHLPGIASAKEIKQKGLAVAEMQTKMMEKIEELTLYLIQQHQQIQQLQKKIELLDK